MNTGYHFLCLGCSAPVSGTYYCEDCEEEARREWEYEHSGAEDQDDADFRRQHAPEVPRP